MKRSLKEALRGDHQALRTIRESLKESSEQKLYHAWVSAAAECGEPSAQEILKEEAQAKSAPKIPRPVQRTDEGQSAQQGPVLVHKRAPGSGAKVPDLKDIHLNDLQTNQIPVDKLKALPWKKIGAGAAVLVLVLAAFSLFGGRKKEEPEQVSYQEPEEMLSEETETPDADLPEDTDATPAASFAYEVRDDGVVIQSFTGSETEVVVPSVIEGKPVVRIESGAFNGNTAVTSVIVKEGVQSIGYGAFGGCRYLEEAILPGTLAFIEGDAFAEDVSLRSLALLEGQQEAVIGSGAFKNCRSLTEVRIPQNYTLIDSSAFLDCDGLQTLALDGSSVFIGYGAFQNCKSLQSITCAGITQVDAYAFQECISLTGIEFPEGLESIGNGAFLGCKNLEEVYIPSTVMRIGSEAFSGAERLERVEIAAGSQDAVIENSCFRSCSSLRTMEIPGNYVTIGDSAFFECISLESVTWEPGTAVYANQVIGYGAFDGCRSLRTAVFGRSLSGISALAFQNCISLEEMEIPEGVVFVDNNAFAGCSGLRRVSIPSTVERLGSSAFAEDESLREVQFEEGKLDAVIGDACFRGCASLETVEIPGNYTRIEWGAFEQCRSLWSFTWKESDAVYENQTMGGNVFSGCEILAEVHLPRSVGAIEGDLFYGMEEVAIYAPEGSAAAVYAEEKGINYVAE